MAKKKEAAEQLITIHSAVPVVLWRANRPLNEEQHEELVRKLKAEQTRSGLEILLVPYSVDVEISVEVREDIQTEAVDVKTDKELNSESDEVEAGDTND